MQRSSVKRPHDPRKGQGIRNHTTFYMHIIILLYMCMLDLPHLQNKRARFVKVSRFALTGHGHSLFAYIHTCACWICHIYRIKELDKG